MSDFKSIQETVQGTPSTFSPFQPSNPTDNSAKSSTKMNSSSPTSSQKPRQVSEVQRLQQQLDSLSQQNQILQKQLEDTQMHQQNMEQNFQIKERELAEKLQYYQEMMSSIQSAYMSSSRDLKENFLDLLKGILNGTFASQMIMDAALYSSLSAVFHELQNEEVLLSVHSDQVDLVNGFIQDLGIQQWVVQTDRTIGIGGFRIESQLSQWLQNPQENVEQIIAKLEEHLKS